MKQTMTTYDIANALNEDKNNGYSWAGCLALAEYLEEMEASTGTEMEFDRVAIRCDFSEYESLRKFAEDQCGKDWKEEIDVEDEDGEEEIDEKIRTFASDNGILLEFDGGIIVSAF